MLPSRPPSLQTSASSFLICRIQRFAGFALAALVLVGCNSVNPYYDAAKPHHTAGGFKNNDGASVNKSTGDFFRWQFERSRDGLPQPPQTPTASVPPDMTFILGNAIADTMQPAITWVGHATMLVQANGLNVLTDPMFSERASPVSFAGPQRVHPPGLRMDQLPRIDVVLISHNHYDHLDRDSVLALSNKVTAETLFLVPLGVKKWFTSLGISNVQELDWWDSVKVKGTDFNFTPVQHWSARSFGDRSQTLWGGWAVLGADTHWYFSGDTGYSQDFVDTQKRFADRQTPAMGGGFDIALIPVGAYEPRWFMKAQHINPAESVQIHQDLKAKRSVGLHWGTFALTDEPLDQPPKDLAAARVRANISDEHFFLLSIGQTRRIDKRTN